MMAAFSAQPKREFVHQRVAPAEELGMFALRFAVAGKAEARSGIGVQYAIAKARHSMDTGHGANMQMMEFKFLPTAKYMNLRTGDIRPIDLLLQISVCVFDRFLQTFRPIDMQLVCVRGRISLKQERRKRHDMIVVQMCKQERFDLSGVASCPAQGLRHMPAGIDQDFAIDKIGRSISTGFRNACVCPKEYK